MTRSPTVVLAIVGDLITVLFRSRANGRESIPPAATGYLPGAQDAPAPRKSRHQIRVGDVKPILPPGERSRDCEAGYLGPLAPSRIPSLLALEVSSRWSSTAQTITASTQPPTLTMPLPSKMI